MATNLFENWYVYVAAIAVLAAGGYGVYRFVKTPSEEQLRKVKEWLLIAVLEAESALGSGTGQMKLRYVYDLFVTRFRWVAYLLTFDRFTELVDEALVEMRKALDTNTNINSMVYLDGKEKWLR